MVHPSQIAECCTTRPGPAQAGSGAASARSLAAAAFAVVGFSCAALAGTPAQAAQPLRPAGGGCIALQSGQGPLRSATLLVNRCTYTVAVTYCVNGPGHGCQAAGVAHLAAGASFVVDSRRAAQGLRKVNWVACRSDAEVTADADPEPLLRPVAFRVTSPY
jgi:hypothetical protein